MNIKSLNFEKNASEKQKDIVNMLNKVKEEKYAEKKYEGDIIIGNNKYKEIDIHDEKINEKVGKNKKFAEKYEEKFGTVKPVRTCVENENNGVGNKTKEGSHLLDNGFSVLEDVFSIKSRASIEQKRLAKDANKIRHRSHDPEDYKSKTIKDIEDPVLGMGFIPSGEVNRLSTTINTITKEAKKSMLEKFENIKNEKTEKANKAAKLQKVLAKAQMDKFNKEFKDRKKDWEDVAVDVLNEKIEKTQRQAEKIVKKIDEKVQKEKSYKRPENINGVFADVNSFQKYGAEKEDTIKFENKRKAEIIRKENKESKENIKEILPKTTRKTMLNNIFKK